MEEYGIQRHKNFFLFLAMIFFQCNFKNLQVVRIKISLEKFLCIVEQKSGDAKWLSLRIEYYLQTFFAKQICTLDTCKFCMACANIDSVDGWNRVEHTLFFYFSRVGPIMTISVICNFLPN